VQLSGASEIAAPRQAVWDLVMDVEALATCGSGVDSIRRLDETHAVVRATVGLGFMTAGVSVDLELVETTPPDAALIRAHTDVSGNRVDATGRLRLSGPTDGPTTIDWSADIEIAGPLAGLGSRLIEGAASGMVDGVFDCIRAKLAAA
jgi:carbon monoxide dehydrogenase subunit G